MPTLPKSVRFIAAIFLLFGICANSWAAPKVTIFYYNEKWQPTVKLDRLNPLSDGLKAILAMYALQNSAGCEGGNNNISCALTDALELGGQCSEKHISLVRTWFQGSLPKMGRYMDWAYDVQKPGQLEAVCYMQPDTSTFQDKWDKIQVTQDGNHLVIDAHGTSLSHEDSTSFKFSTEYEILDHSIRVISHKSK